MTATLNRRRERYKCKDCGERWSQSPLGWCRRCERAVYGARDQAERERIAQALQTRREMILLRRAAPALPPPTITVDGIDYEVINDALGFGRAR
jgi:hypothetical protein